jgi:hypothetical protein
MLRFRLQKKTLTTTVGISLGIRRGDEKEKI